MRQRRSAKLLGTFFLFGLLFNYPMMHIWGAGGIVLGVPKLVFFLFFFWLAMIVLLMLIVEQKARPGSRTDP